MAKVNIYRDKSHEPTVKAINNSKMFENNAHFLTFCAHYGVSINKRKKIKERGIEINTKTFLNYLKDIYIVALSTVDDVTILNNNDEIYEIFEEFANGGLIEIHKKVNKNITRDETGIDTILQLLAELRNKIDSVEDSEVSLKLPLI